MATFSISELAREFNVTPRTMRFYEDQGLIAPQRTGAGGKQRVYTVRDRTRLKLTLRGKRLGLSLAEVRSLIDMYESPADTAPQLGRFLEVLEHHRSALERQLADLQLTLAEIAEHKARAQNLLAKIGQN
ncbi:MAG: MerR family DNA-binding transcriptional regulator [Burkholderiaceae bacterium]|nr:MerR family DNA-binding transcriptional regulator [Burkholderiaceae bacterium]